MSNADNSQPNGSSSGGMHSKLLGRVLGGKYRILELIGQGGMGAVFKGEHILMDRTVAIKILHSHLTYNDTFLKRFHQEARVSSKINHPNAVTIWDFGIEEDLPYLIMEYVHGRSLKEVIATEGALTPEVCLHVLKEMSGALEAAHALGVVHRDLKPDNLLVTVDAEGKKQIRVLDFGIAKVLRPDSEGQENSTVMTQAGTLMGTPAYLSPEQALEKVLDARSDIYSVGIILYEMLTGKVPFQSTSSPLDVYIQHIRNAPPAMRTLTPDRNLPEAVCMVVMKSLEKEPVDRFQTVSELVQAFELATKLQAAPTPSGPLKIKPVPRWPYAAAAGAAVLGLALVGFLATRGSETEDVDSAAESQQLASVTPESEVAEPEIPESGTLKVESPEATTAEEEKAAEAIAVEPQLPAADEAAPQVIDPTARALAPTEPVAEVVAAEPAPATRAEPVIDEQDTRSALTSELLETDLISPLPVEETNFGKAAEAATAEEQLKPEVKPEVEIAEIEGADRLLQPLADEASLKALSPAKARNEAARLFKEGGKLLEQKNYLEAGLRYQRGLVLEPNNLEARLNFGSSLLRLGKLDAAKDNFLAALKLEPEYPPTLYNIATYYALSGNAEESFKYLQSSMNFYPGTKKWLENDVDFSSLRSDPRFQQLLGGK